MLVFGANFTPTAKCARSYSKEMEKKHMRDFFLLPGMRIRIFRNRVETFTKNQEVPFYAVYTKKKNLQ